jgi:hypothetical protein
VAIADLLLFSHHDLLDFLLEGDRLFSKNVSIYEVVVVIDSFC